MVHFQIPAPQDCALFLSAEDSVSHRCNGPVCQGKGLAVNPSVYQSVVFKHITAQVVNATQFLAVSNHFLLGDRIGW